MKGKSLQNLTMMVSCIKVVQLNFTQDIEVFYMQFERYLSIFSMTSLEQHIHQDGVDVAPEMERN